MLCSNTHCHCSHGDHWLYSYQYTWMSTQMDYLLSVKSCLHFHRSKKYARNFFRTQYPFCYSLLQRTDSLLPVLPDLSLRPLRFNRCERSRFALLCLAMAIRSSRARLLSASPWASMCCSLIIWSMKSSIHNI